MHATPLALIILDGFGCRANPAFNAIAQAQMPHTRPLWEKYPHSLLEASGVDVGLPPKQMGNSEVGHLNIGSGRIVYQDSMRITNAIESGSLDQNTALLSAIQYAHTHQRPIHLLGLLSDGGVHSLQTHCHAIAALCHQHDLDVVLHLFLDGRDTPPKSAANYIDTLEKFIKNYPRMRIASIMGRYYAMDRDKRWDRTERAYRCLTEGLTEYRASNAQEALQAAYSRQETDEFVAPTTLSTFAPIQSQDAVIFFNFRADRARQLSMALANPDFNEFKRPSPIARLVSLTEYATKLKADIAFPATRLKNTLGEVLSYHHLKQLRIAETEKYAHVTFFFNGGEETPFEGEERLLIPSPAVATYDLQPQMSAFELTDELVKAILSRSFDVIICNYANADMVGHTGQFDAAVKAIETLDICVGRVIDALRSVGGEALITADHGNAEMMFDETTQQPHTSHTLEKVPLLYVGNRGTLEDEGRLCDIAPTMLRLLELPQPSDMTGKSLLK